MDGLRLSREKILELCQLKQREFQEGSRFFRAESSDLADQALATIDWRLFGDQHDINGMIQMADGAAAMLEEAAREGGASFDIVNALVSFAKPRRPDRPTRMDTEKLVVIAAIARQLQVPDKFQEQYCIKYSGGHPWTASQATPPPESTLKQADLTQGPNTPDQRPG